MPIPLCSRRRVAGVVLALAALAGCGRTSDGTAETTTPDPTTSTDGVAAAPNGDTVTVQALDNSFRPETIEISVGTQVLFDNRGRNEHNVLPVDESQDWGVQVGGFQPGDTYTYVFTTPGEYQYFCSIHGTADVGMTGTIIVSA